MVELLKNWPVDQPVPAISLRQPWASAVALFGKDVENRSNWPFKHRGPLIIQASATKPYRSDLELFLKLAREDGATDDDLADISSESYPLNLFPHGQLIAVVNLAAVLERDDDVPENHPANESPWADDEANYWLYFSEAVALVPVQYKGALGMFKVPYDIAEKLEPIPLESG